MADTWELLEKQCLHCKECALCETRTNVVFGDGSRQAEILLVATLVPNPILDSPKAKFYNEQMHQGKELEKFVGEGIGMVDIHRVQLSLMERKRFVDMTGNNVNHPNDFMVRVYAQVVSAALIENFGGAK